MRLAALPQLAALLTISLGVVPCVQAATITAGFETTVANLGAVPNAPANYIFFGDPTKPVSLLDFTVSTVASGQFGGVFGGGSYTMLDAPDGSGIFTTGALYDTSCYCGNTATLATFSVLKDSNFIVYILNGNTDGNGIGDSSVGLAVNGDAAIVTPSTFRSGHNVFTEFDVTHASKSDIFSVQATGSAGGPTIGGLTFTDVQVAPEPETLSLVGTGALALAGFARRKRRA